MGNTRVVILAAGRGTRMGADVPKVLVPVGGVSMLTRLVDSVHASGIDRVPLVVVSPDSHAAIRNALGARAAYVVQADPRGTGDAVRVACAALGAETTHIQALYGDHPFIRAKQLHALAVLHGASDAPLACFTTPLPDFSGWRSAFTRFGRMVRDTDGALTRIVEYTDATDEERAIMEVNPGLYRFSVSWLRDTLPTLTPRNAQGEYYLTDCVARAIAQGYPVPTAPLTPEESIGINTPEDVARAEMVISNTLLQ